MDLILSELKTLAERFEHSSPTFSERLKQREPIAFLERNIGDSELVAYAVADNIFIHTIFAPSSGLQTAKLEELLGWQGNAYSSWGILSTSKPEKRVYLEPPLYSMGPKSLTNGEQLVFARDFEGMNEGRSYLELLQKFVHVSGIHYAREHDAWCALDQHGELEKKARIVNIPETERCRGGRALVIDRRLLDQYALLTDATMARMFEFTGVDFSRFSGWASTRTETVVINEGLIYRECIQSDASYVRGVQTIPPSMQKQELINYYIYGAPASPKQYADFIVYDWKNKRTIKTSCDPAATANYFTESEKPFDITPAFFRPDVLLKYKADTRKYTVESRSIACRGTWTLKTYDINEAGQVHTYLIYLSQLPYGEQLYWQSFNEDPKGPISSRAYKTDICGEFSHENEPIDALKALLYSLAERTVSWWKLRDENLLRHLVVPATTSPDEWANDLMNLDKAIIEGLEEKWLRKKAAALGCGADDRARSLKLLEACLVGLKFEADHAHTLLAPLHEVHNLRSEQKSHPAGDTARRKREEILLKHTSFRAHFNALCQECVETLSIVDRAFQ